EVNSTTGTTAVAARIKVLAKSPDAKQLIQYAAEELKKDRMALSYNGAYILAVVARQKKELAASEAFYHVCAKEAADLESKEKLEQSFRGLTGLLFENKKYKQTEKVCKQVLELVTGPGKPRVVFIEFQFAPGKTTFMPLEKFDAAKQLRHE